MIADEMGKVCKAHLFTQECIYIYFKQSANADFRDTFAESTLIHTDTQRE